MNHDFNLAAMGAELDKISPFKERVAHVTLDERQCRIAELRDRMKRAQIDAALLIPGVNLRYMSGVRWGLSERLIALILTEDEALVVCPKFEEGSIAPEIKIPVDMAYWEEHEDPNALVASILKKMGKSAIAVDPKAPLWLYERLVEAMPQASFSNAEMFIGPMRSLKSRTELDLMREAKLMTLEVQRRAADFLQEGIRASQVKNFIDQAHRAIGADNGSTFCIVQFGRSTAFPHGLPRDDILKDGDLVLIDTGCAVDGYQSDITRTYAFGTPDDEVRRIWEIEKATQQAVFDAAELGKRCGDLDLVARAHLEKFDLGPGYLLPGLPHRTGHGIGLEVHEGPYLMLAEDTLLAPGMCFSNEPMIVIPEQFGVRLEDHFYMSEDGPVWFTEPQPDYVEPFKGMVPLV